MVRCQVRKALEDASTRRSRMERSRAAKCDHGALEGIEERATRKLENCMRIWEA